MIDQPQQERSTNPAYWENLRSQVSACMRCPLGFTRTHAIFGEGPPDARLIFVGEAPGAQEDERGAPFVGRSGKLLTQVLHANGIDRADVFISNIVKCRPPQNRDPSREEIAACSPYLFTQIEAIDPPLVCVLGRHAAATLLGRAVKITAEHGVWLPFQGRHLMIALHPSAALRTPAFRAGFEHDMQVLAERYRAISSGGG